MKVHNTPLSGLVIIESPVFRDTRGTFQRLQCVDAFRENGLPATFVQTNLATNSSRNILRGMHFQKAPYGEEKLVRCVDGKILDIVIDIRPESPTYLQHFRVELTHDNALALLVPKGFAHGYLTLTDAAAVLYHVSTPYTPHAEGGIRWNDPTFGITWPAATPLLSDKDAAWPDFIPERTL
jgi:dTDP-4-dehydrorhamnose 3,5-epimerase